VVSQCGRVVPPGDARALAGALSDLLGAPDEAKALGALARSYAEKHLTLDAVLCRMVNRMTARVARREEVMP
jgi:colanic acid biosynthesis glycosyl transferase WcaI